MTWQLFYSATAKMRALRFFLCAALAFSLSLPQAAFAEVRRADVVCGETVEARGLSVSQCPSIDAAYACVMDSEGNIYFERDALESTQIASITKVMTALVVLDAIDEGSVSFDDEVVVSAEAAEVGESSAGLQEGDIISVLDALKGLLIPSGNDAATAIAQMVGEAVSGASGDAAQEAFVALMNQKAEELGCVNTLYSNPHGLDNGDYAGDQHSCAADQALVVQSAMQNETFRQIVASGNDTISVSRGGELITLELESTDEFLDMYEYACGVKTGYTDLAGASFAAAAYDGELYLYAIVINSSSVDQRFVDAQTLCEWVYDNMCEISLANSGTTMQCADLGGEVEVVAYVAHQDWIDKTVAVCLSDPDATCEVFSLKGNVSQSFSFNEVSGSVSVGDVLGTVSYYQHNELIAEYDLVACEEVAAPDFFEGIGIFFDRLLRNFSGEAQVAESSVISSLELVYDKTAA